MSAVQRPMPRSRIRLERTSSSGRSANPSRSNPSASAAARSLAYPAFWRLNPIARSSASDSSRNALGSTPLASATSSPSNAARAEASDTCCSRIRWTRVAYVGSRAQSGGGPKRSTEAASAGSAFVSPSTALRSVRRVRGRITGIARSRGIPLTVSRRSRRPVQAEVEGAQDDRARLARSDPVPFEERVRQDAIQVDLLAERGQDRRGVQRPRDRPRERITVIADDGLRSPSARGPAFTVERQQTEQHLVAHVLQAVQGLVELATQDLRLDVPGPGPDPRLHPS